MTAGGDAFLPRILRSTRAALERRRAAEPEARLVAGLSAAPALCDVLGALSAPGVAVIAEVKRASPSRGAFAGGQGLDPARLAATYARAGAAAVSVLTEEAHFQGSLADLRAAREALDAVGLGTPLLRKDFFVDAYQLLEARLAGASLVLLIVAALDDAALADLYAAALDLGLTPLVEIHDRPELERALALGARLVGVNNRDLCTFRVDLAVTERLRPHVPAGCLLVSESGVRSAEDVRRLAGVGVDAVLVGEALVTAADPAAALAALVEAGR